MAASVGRFDGLEAEDVAALLVVDQGAEFADEVASQPTAAGFLGQRLQRRAGGVNRDVGLVAVARGGLSKRGRTGIDHRVAAAQDHDGLAATYGGHGICKLANRLQDRRHLRPLPVLRIANHGAHLRRDHSVVVVGIGAAVGGVHAPTHIDDGTGAAGGPDADLRNVGGGALNAVGQRSEVLGDGGLAVEIQDGHVAFRVGVGAGEIGYIAADGLRQGGGVVKEEEQVFAFRFAPREACNGLLFAVLPNAEVGGGETGGGGGLFVADGNVDQDEAGFGADDGLGEGCLARKKGKKADQEVRPTHGTSTAPLRAVSSWPSESRTTTRTR